MKAIPIIELTSALEEITEEKRQSASKINIPFAGIHKNELMSALDKKFGSDNWSVIKNKFTLKKEDISAVANSRFYKKSGLKLLLGAVAIMLLISTMTNTWQIITPNISYVLYGLEAIGFVYLYSRWQAKARKDTMHEIYGGREEKEEK